PPRPALFPYTTLFRSPTRSRWAWRARRPFTLTTACSERCVRLTDVEGVTLAVAVSTDAATWGHQLHSADAHPAARVARAPALGRSEEHTSELQSPCNL